MKGKVLLSHCLVEGKLHNVSDFAHLLPKDRPRAICWECELELVLKLGTSGKITHHAAHKAENRECSLTNPEGALHFNTKAYIYEQLQNGIEKGSKLFIRQNCAGWTRPDSLNRSCSRLGKGTRPFLWLESWDSVRMEKSVQNRLRPDIVLFKNGQPIGAVEVFVTNAVDEEKMEKFQSIGLPWIEIKAEGEIIDEYFVDWAEEDEEEFPWKIEKPLIYHACFPTPDEWICSDCLEAPARYAERQNEIEEQKAIREAEERTQHLKRIAVEREKERKKLLYSQKQDNNVLKAIAVIWLKPFGNTEIFELFVIERHNSEYPYEPHEIYLKVGEFDGNIIASEEPITENSKRIIFESYKEWLREKQTFSRTAVEITGWVTESELKSLRTKYEELNPSEWRGGYWKRKS